MFFWYFLAIPKQHPQGETFPLWILRVVPFSLIQTVNQVRAFRRTSFSHVLHLSGCHPHPPEEEQMARAHRPITTPAKKWPCQGLGDIGVVDILSNFMKFQQFQLLNPSLAMKRCQIVNFYFPSSSETFLDSSPNLYQQCEPHLEVKKVAFV